ncbi:zeta toxin family protein [Rummeliibacillus suwonensis]|uniref:zeta toxin family protein n=1 Tax=Rummeliibacillus suwonensis TaxID=1306154 RepID=UPI0011B6AC0D|nr:zeta toxin family protein [Rummeliibacillus suwonensis]
MKEESTKLKYCLNGKYTKERRKLHKAIIHSIIEDSPTENPESILMGGGSASGKSFISSLLLKGFKQEGQPITYIDSDDIKKYLPEYKEMVNSGIDEFIKKAASFVHDESSDIAEELLNICIEKKLHFIYDGTMKNAEKYKRIIKQLKRALFTIRGVIVDVPLEVAFERAEIRYMAEGRKVPDEDIIASHENVAVTFSKIYEDFDTFVMYDNTTKPAIPFAIKESKESPIEIINQARLEEFHNKVRQTVKTTD